MSAPIPERVKALELERLIGERMNVLDDGFVRVVDYMGSDESIVQAARVSYGTGTKRLSEDRGLIRYLLRNYHTTPFEMCENDNVGCQWTAGVNGSGIEQRMLTSIPRVIRSQSIQPKRRIQAAGGCNRTATNRVTVKILTLKSAGIQPRSVDSR